MRKQLYNEEDAFSALQKGEEKGLDFFFNSYYSALTIFSLSITRNKEAAQDVVADAFIKLWKNRQGLADAHKVKALLYRMVHNASIDYLRAEKTNKQRAQVFYEENSERNVLEKMIAAETYHKLYLLLPCLPPRTAQVFRMFYLQDKPIKKIAEELGISVNTVKSLKLRALQLLRENKTSLTVILLLFK